MYSNMTKEQLISRLRSLEKSPKAHHKPAKEFDWSKTVARKVALKISYLGQNYYGFTGLVTDALPTIEKELFKALLTCKLIPSPESCGWAKAGRTDKGVSGFGQVVSLWIKSKLPSTHPSVLNWEVVKSLAGPTRLEDSENLPIYDENLDAGHEEYHYLDMLNRLLPEDIRILAWTPVHQSFDARFSCRWRKYKYFFSNQHLDLEKMNSAAQLFIGTHDCRFICKLDSSKIENDKFFIREIYEADVQRVNDSFSCFTVRGRAFLWHQVRNMMALLFLVGNGSESPSIISTMLDPSSHPENAGKPNYDMAPDHPLVLIECGYEGLQWNIQGQYGQKTLQILNNQWNDLTLKALQIQTLRNEVISLGVDPNLPLPKQKRHIEIMKRTRADSVNTLRLKKKLKN